MGLHGANGMEQIAAGAAASGRSRITAKHPHFILTRRAQGGSWRNPRFCVGTLAQDIPALDRRHRPNQEFDKSLTCLEPALVSNR